MLYINKTLIEWLYVTREIDSRILCTIMHLFHSLLLFTIISSYFAVDVSICFTGQVKSLYKSERQADQSISKINIHLKSKHKNSFH